MDEHEHVRVRRQRALGRVADLARLRHVLDEIAEQLHSVADLGVQLQHLRVLHAEAVVDADVALHVVRAHVELDDRHLRPQDVVDSHDVRHLLDLPADDLQPIRELLVRQSLAFLVFVELEANVEIAGFRDETVDRRAEQLRTR